MSEDTLTKLKKDIQSDVAGNTPAFYVDFCRLLEYSIKQLTKQYNLPFNSDSLNDNFLKLCDDISFNDIKRERIRCCIIKRNEYIHSPERIPQVDRTILRHGCIAYNDFITEIKKKYTHFSYSYQIDKSIFDSDVIFVDNTQKPQRTSGDDVFVEMTIRDLENKLEELRNLGEENTETYSDFRFLLFCNYKKQLKFKIEDKHFTRLTDRVEEFYYNIVINDSDSAFKIVGVPRAGYCRNSDRFFYSVIHGIICKSRVYQPSIFLQDKIEAAGVVYNYKYILRYQLLILSMIKNNCFDEELNVDVVDGTEEELHLAFDDIIHYLNLLAQLQKKQVRELRLKISHSGVKISVRSKEGRIHVEDTEKNSSINSFIWVERASLYHISDMDTDILNELSADLFGRDYVLKADQKEAIIGILNSSKNSMCLMPTGYGKSLIFYLVAFLRTGISVVVCPTETLIKDQIRNLKNLHNITAVSEYFIDNDFTNYVFTSRLVYVNAEVFLNKTFVERLGKLANDGYISGIVLDEVHSLSLWSHDFRPDYIMLAEYVKRYVPNIPIISFTATASSKVLLDLKDRLHISNSNIYEAQSLKRSDITVEVRNTETVENNYKRAADLLSALSEKGRTLVFVKQKKDSEKLLANLNSYVAKKCDTLLNFDKDIFTEFVDGKTNTLIVGHDMGVGINLPKINYCLHVGYPVSVNQFVQEVGRVAREGDAKGTAYIIAQKFDSLADYEKELLDMGMSIDEVIGFVQSYTNYDSDIISVYKYIFGYLDNAGKTFMKVDELYKSIAENKSIDSLYFYPVRNAEERKRVQFYLILLTKIGLLNDWYYSGNDKDIASYDIYRSADISLTAVKERSVRSMREMGADDTAISLIKSGGSITDLILQYVMWYYNEFLLNQREQLTNLIHSIDDGNLLEYFEINIENLEEVRRQINEMSLSELFTKKEEYFDKKKIVAAKRLCEVSQNVKYDIVLLWSSGLKEHGDFSGRWRRVVSALGEDYIKINYKYLVGLYNNCSVVNRRIIFEQLITDVDKWLLLTEFFDNAEKDENFYLLLAAELNNKLEGING